MYLQLSDLQLLGPPIPGQASIYLQTGSVNLQSLLPKLLKNLDLPLHTPESLQGLNKDSNGSDVSLQFKSLSAKLVLHFSIHCMRPHWQ